MTVRQAAIAAFETEPQAHVEQLEQVGIRRRILAEPSPDRRARLTRDTLARGRQARDKHAAGGTLSQDEARDFNYLQAVTKMQAGRVKR